MLETGPKIGGAAYDPMYELCAEAEGVVSYMLSILPRTQDLDQFMLEAEGVPIVHAAASHERQHHLHLEASCSQNISQSLPPSAD